MKILQVAAGLQETCGVSNFVVESSRILQKLGHEVCIVTSMTCGYPVEDLQIQLLEDPRQVDFQPDLVHLHSCWNLYIHRMAVWCRKRGIPYVLSPHGALTPWALRYKWWKKWPALLLYQYRDLQKAAAFHVTAEAEAGDFARLHLSAPVVTAPLGIALPEKKQAVLKKKDLLFLGRIHPVKGLGELLEAWSRLALSQRCGWRLVIAGPDDIGYQETLKAEARELGLSVHDYRGELAFGKKQIQGGEEVPVSVYQEKLEQRDSDIVFTGPVYGEARDFLYAQSRYFILPSHSENFGVVVLEALAAGTPVIASRGTPWQALEEHGCGWWIPGTAEQIRRTLAEVLALPEEEYSSCSERGARWVREAYSWDRVGAVLQNAYQKIGEKN